jgi:hypothetical protein
VAISYRRGRRCRSLEGGPVLWVLAAIFQHRGHLRRSGRGTPTCAGLVGYNVQVAVDTEHDLIVAREVTNSGSERAQLANIASHSKAVLVEKSNVLIKLFQEILNCKPRRGERPTGSGSVA